MKKNIFIMFLLIIIFIILFILIFLQIQNLKNTKATISNQAKKLSANSILNVENNLNTDSEEENTSDLQLSFEDIRKKEIQDKINEFGKNETGIPVLMYHFFMIVPLAKRGKIIIF